MGSEGSGRMLLDDVPALKFIVMMARAASKEIGGVSPEEEALRQVEDRIREFWDLRVATIRPSLRARRSAIRPR